MTSAWLKRRAAARVQTRLWLAGGAALLYCLLVSVGLAGRASWGSNPDTVAHSANPWVSLERTGRERRDTSGADGNGSLAADGDTNDANETCTPRAVENFPGNFLTLKETQEGGVFLHILISLYLFAALAIVCDDYFVPALELICEDLGLQEDVAGATFMAAGSSAPELCTSIVGVFIAQNDVGVGTIVGSAVFNILFIIGVCGIFAGMVVELTWYPLMRDTLFYLISVLALVIVIQDSSVYWYEAMIMVLLYALYILLMYFNRRLETRAETLLVVLRARLGLNTDYKQDSLDEETPLGASAAAAKKGQTGGSAAGSTLAGNGSTLAVGNGSTSAAGENATVPEAETGFGSSSSGSVEKSGAEQGEDKWESPFEIPDKFITRIYWVAVLPITAVCFCTIPDCRRGGKWRRAYPLTFLNSVIWISGFTYIMVWMISIAGDALDIPDTVMGLTLLAAGTSLPDCLASLLVARDGYGDMAVSNTVGSNVFDILLCLGLPWFIDTAILKKGAEALTISSSGLLYSALTLLATVIFLLVSVALNKWRLTKGYGLICLAAYVVVIVLSSLYELNVFADLNPPACPR